MATHANLKIIDDIGLNRDHHLSPEVKSHILRRLESEQKKRPLPEATYEQWHHGNEGEVLVADEDQPTLKRKRSADLPNAHSLGFDVHLRSAAIEELSLHLGSSDDTRDESSEAPAPSESEEDDSSSDSDSDEEEDGADSDFDSDEQEGSAQVGTEDEATEELRQSIKFGEKLDQWNSPTDNLRSWHKNRFLLKLWGLEKVGDGAEVINSSISKQHLRSLTSLLHINILRRRWLVAYKIVCLLARFDAVDLRVLWPIATEVLLRRRVELLDRGRVSKLDVIKEEQFLECIILSFPVSSKVFYSIETYQGPVFRMSTRTYAPVYVLTLLWKLLVKRKYSKLRDMLTDLILLPPYSTDGVFFYLLILCNVAESIHLVSSYVHFDERGIVLDNEDIGDLADDMMLLGSKDTIKSRILSNVKSAYDMLRACENLSFEFPKEALHSDLESISSILRGECEIGNFQANSESPAAGPYARAGFVLAEGELRMGKGQNLIRGEILYRLLVKHKQISPLSWIWNWIEPKSSSRKLCICKICGKEILHIMKAFHHLAEHRIDHKSAPRICIQPDSKHVKFLESFIDAQIPRREFEKVSTPRYGARDVEFNPPQSPPDHVQTPEPEATMNAVNLSDQNTPENHDRDAEIGNSPRDESGRPDVPAEIQEEDIARSDSHNSNNGEGAVSTNSNAKSEANSHPASEGDAFNAEISGKDAHQESNFKLSEPNDKVSTNTSSSNVRRYNGFSPDSTFDAKNDCDISRNFQEFSTQTRRTQQLQTTDALSLTQIDTSSDVMLDNLSFLDTPCANKPNQDDHQCEQNMGSKPKQMISGDGTTLMEV